MEGSLPSVLCCVCGTQIQPNVSSMCVACVRSSVDITEEINRTISIHNCRSCKRFLLPPWTEAQLESKVLMAACLKKIPALKKLKLIDAAWVWTEPHSMRLKIKLTVQKEVIHGAILQQATVVEYMIRNKQCEDCEESFAQGIWHGLVQVRQHVVHKRTFYYLEQVILKHNAHGECTNIITFKDGMDFYFQQKQQAVRFVSFLESHVPIKKSHTRKLISHDSKSNVGNYKDYHLVEIVPLCKDDFLVLPKKIAKSLSDISQLVLVKNVGKCVHLVDPLSDERSAISSEKYWNNQCKDPFIASMNSRHLIRFIVLSIEPVGEFSRASAKQKRGGNRLAECVVVRERDFGNSDKQFTTKTHLGYVLKENDLVLGYDISSAAFPHDEVIQQRLGERKIECLPDIILVRKLYEIEGRRSWKLKELDVDVRDAMNASQHADAQVDHEIFMQEIEGDKEMRNYMNVYRSEGKDRTVNAGRRFKKIRGSESKKLKGHIDNLDYSEIDLVNRELDEEEVRFEELLENFESTTFDTEHELLM